MDPLAGSSWSAPATVAGFRRGQPNAVLMTVAEGELRRFANPRLLDIGCGAGRNAVPLARMGWRVVGTDLSWPMLAAAAERAAAADARVRLMLSPMETIPAADRSFDMVVAHGIWNLARSAAQFRQSVREAARVAKPGAALFVFTFSRHTLPEGTAPVAGEPFVYTQFAGAPQCFLTGDQLVAEMAAAGFEREAAVPLREYNRQAAGALGVGLTPVIYEAVFRRAVTPAGPSSAAS